VVGDAAEGRSTFNLREPRSQFPFLLIAPAGADAADELVVAVRFQQAEEQLVDAVLPRSVPDDTLPLKSAPDFRETT